jgi:hypothetical protein
VDVARRRFVDRVCLSRRALLLVDGLLEEERFEEEWGLPDGEAARRGWNRFVRAKARAQRALGNAWTPPPAPDPSAPREVRLLDVLVSRVLRAADDPFARNAIRATSREFWWHVVGAVRVLERGSQERTRRFGVTTVDGRTVHETWKLSDRLGRSVYASVLLYPAFHAVDDPKAEIPAGGVADRVLDDIYLGEKDAQEAALGILWRARRARGEAAAPPAGHEEAAVLLH